MAQKTVVTLISDLSGGDADETVRFGLDGAEYRVDLSASEADGLRAAMAPYVSVARRSSRGSGAARPAAAVRAGRVSPSKVRAWADSEGLKVNARGRISDGVLAAYRAAQPVFS